MLLMILDVRSSTQLSLEFQLQPIYKLEQFIFCSFLKYFLDKIAMENMHAEKRNIVSNEY